MRRVETILHSSKQKTAVTSRKKLRDTLISPHSIQKINEIIYVVTAKFGKLDLLTSGQISDFLFPTTTSRKLPQGFIHDWMCTEV